MYWYRQSWYWSTAHSCWHVDYSLTRWLLGIRFYLGEVEIYIGPLSFGYSDIL